MVVYEYDVCINVVDYIVKVFVIYYFVCVWGIEFVCGIVKVFVVVKICFNIMCKFFKLLLFVEKIFIL